MSNKQELLNLISMKYPKVSGLIEAAWTESDFNELVNKLLMDSRDGKRQGFPMEITKAIFDLIKLHDEEYKVTGWQDSRRTNYPDADR